MIVEEIIKRLQEQILENAENKDLYERYKTKEALNNQMVQLQQQLKTFVMDIENLEEEKNSYSFFKRILDNSYNKTKMKIAEKKNEKDKIEANILNLQAKINNIEFTDQELETIELCKLIDSLIDAYNNKNTQQLIDGLIEYFKTDFKMLMSFCKENKIQLDFSSELGFDFISLFKDRFCFRKSTIGLKYSKLEDLILVRKCVTVPENDKIVPSCRNFFEKIERTIEYDGIKHQIETIIPAQRSYPTLHFMLNQEVLPHINGIEGWKNCNIIIMQPVTDKIYNQASGLEPVDWVFEDTVELEDYLIVCDSQERANEIMQKNKNATVFIFSKERINGSGNMILECLGYHVLYRVYNGARLDGQYNYEECFDKEFLAKYPRLATDHVRGPYNPLHEFSSSLKNICTASQVLDYVLALASKEECFEDAIKKTFEVVMSKNVGWNHERIDFYSCRKNNLILSSIIDTNYQGFTSFIDEIIAMGINNLDPQQIFEKLIGDIQITEENKKSLLKVKELLIREVIDFQQNPHDVEAYNKFIYKVFVLRKIVTSNIINKKLNSNIDINNILKYVDFSNLEDFSNRIVETALNENRSLGDCLSLFNKELCLNFAQLKLSRPQDNFTNDFIKQIISIAKIEDSEEMDRQIALLAEKYMLPEKEKSFFMGYICQCMYLKDISKLSYLPLAITVLKYFNPDLIKQEDIGFSK